MATYCFNLAAILAVNVTHSSRVITRDQQAKIADTQTLGRHVEWHIFTFIIFAFYPKINFLMQTKSRTKFRKEILPSKIFTNISNNDIKKMCSDKIIQKQQDKLDEEINMK